MAILINKSSLDLKSSSYKNIFYVFVLLFVSLFLIVLAKTFYQNKEIKTIIEIKTEVKKTVQTQEIKQVLEIDLELKKGIPLLIEKLEQTKAQAELLIPITNKDEFKEKFILIHNSSREIVGTFKKILVILTNENSEYQNNFRIQNINIFLNFFENRCKRNMDEVEDFFAEVKHNFKLKNLNLENCIFSITGILANLNEFEIEWKEICSNSVGKNNFC